MLYSSAQAAKDQLLADLSVVRDKLAKGWNVGWGDGEETFCIMAAINTTVGLETTCTWQPADVSAPEGLRQGRLVLAVYRTLYGPKADLSVTMASAASKIIQFNDRDATNEAVTLLFDRAIANLQSGVLDAPAEGDLA